MEELDFGPISVVPTECCDNNSDLDFGNISENEIENVIEQYPIRRNYTIIAYKEFNAETCKDREFTVNMHTNGSWSFTFTNGTFLTQEQIKCYCDEIAGAQSLLETEQNWFNQGKGLGKWNFGPNGPYGPNGTAGNSSGTGTTYFPAGRSNDPFQSGPCSVQGPNAF